jgi:hypothetical protein
MRWTQSERSSRTPMKIIPSLDWGTPGLHLGSAFVSRGRRPKAPRYECENESAWANSFLQDGRILVAEAPGYAAPTRLAICFARSSCFQ